MATRFIAWRFMLRGTEKGAFSPMTLFAWLAIGVGVGAMSSLLSVMYGFESSLKEKVLNAYPHVLITAQTGNQPIEFDPNLKNKVNSLKHVEQVIPYVQTEMILQTEKKNSGVVIWGLPVEQMSNLKLAKTVGEWPRTDDSAGQILLGNQLAERLYVEVGDSIKLISPVQKTGPLGLVPKSRNFFVSGVFSSGHYDFDEQYALLVIEDAQELISIEDKVTGWQVWVNPLDEAESTSQLINEFLPMGIEAKSWEKFNSALFQSLKLEQYSMFAILSFSILIAVMNIVITLTMNVAHKKKNIGILRAIGATQEQIRKIFLWQGGLMGAVGMTIGAVLTSGFVIYVKYLSPYQLPDIYYDRSIPIELRPLSLTLIYLVATVLVYLATSYPASQAAKLNIIESIRE